MRTKWAPRSSRARSAAGHAASRSSRTCPTASRARSCWRSLRSPVRLFARPSCSRPRSRTHSRRSPRPRSTRPCRSRARCLRGHQGVPGGTARVLPAARRRLDGRDAASAIRGGRPGEVRGVRAEAVPGPAQGVEHDAQAVAAGGDRRRPGLARRRGHRSRDARRGAASGRASWISTGGCRQPASDLGDIVHRVIGDLQDDIERVRTATDIVTVVSRYVQLKRAGRNLKACCPFHDEKTPSFNVNPEKQFFKCFGCGAGGSVFDFVMRIERQTFVEAPARARERGRDRAQAAEGDRLSRARPATTSRACSTGRRGGSSANLAHQEGEACRRLRRETRHLRRRKSARFGLGYSRPGWRSLLDEATAAEDRARSPARGRARAQEPAGQRVRRVPQPPDVPDHATRRGASSRSARGRSTAPSRST